MRILNISPIMQGRIARAVGKIDRDNPFPPKDIDNHLAWLAGWAYQNRRIKELMKQESPSAHVH